MKMRFAILAAALGLGISVAGAADLPFKAPAPAAASPFATEGVFYAVYMAGAAGSADVKNIPGLNAASLTTVQGELGGEIGYRWASANNMKFFDVLLDVGYQNLNGNTAGLSLSGPVAIEAGARVGVPMAAITSLFPSFNLANFPTLIPPTSATILSTQAYIGGAVRIEDISPNFGALKNTEWAFSPVAMVGVIQAFDNGKTMEGRMEYIGAASKCVGPVLGACATIDHRIMAKALIGW